MDNRKSTPPSGINLPSRYGYVIVTACFIIVMMNVGMYLTIGVFFKPISQDMGWTRAETSLPISISTLVTAIMSIIAGSLVDKYGPRKIAFIFALITGAGYLLMSQLSSLWGSIFISVGRGAALVPLSVFDTVLFLVRLLWQAQYRPAVDWGLIASGINFLITVLFHRAYSDFGHLFMGPNSVSS
jgi:MFS family permease